MPGAVGRPLCRLYRARNDPRNDPSNDPSNDPRNDSRNRCSHN